MKSEIINLRKKSTTWGVINKLSSFLLVFSLVFLGIIAVLVQTNANFVYGTGDVDGDGRITRNDVYYILSRAANVNPIDSDEYLPVADVDFDGKITLNDAKIVCGRIDDSDGNVVDLGSNKITQIVLGNRTFTDKNGNKINAESAFEKIAENTSVGNVSDDKFYVYPDLSEVMKLRDQFVIISFGWGHCIGMSQYGAVGLARLGYSYIDILQHYYTGIAIMKEKPVDVVRLDGSYVDTQEMVSRIVQQEISGITSFGDALDAEALKAQAVAAYTNMKRCAYKVEGCTYAYSYDDCRSDVKNAVKEVLGQFMTYNSEPIDAYYSACSAGVTSSYKNVWGYGTKDIPYLQSVSSYPDIETSVYVQATAFTPEALKRYLLSYDPSLDLQNNKIESWIKILEHDDAVNENIGYVTKMQIGSRVIDSNAGMRFRDNVMDYEIGSPCFCIIYNGKYL